MTFAMRGLRVSAIDRHRHESIDQRDGVGARLLRNVRHLRNAGHVRRKLHDQRPLRNPFRRRHNFVQRTRITPELQTAVRRVRAGNVQFVGGNPFAIVENLDGSFVILTRVAEDVGEEPQCF